MNTYDLDKEIDENYQIAKWAYHLKLYLKKRRIQMETDNKISIRFYRNKGRISLSPTASAYLELPKSIKILADQKYNRLIIQKCEMGDEGSFPIVGRAYSSHYGGMRLSSQTLVFHIFDSNDWDKKFHYIVQGAIDPDKADMILFDLSKAEKIAP